MKSIFGVLLASALCTSMAFTSVARADWALILKAGNYKLSDDSQRLEDRLGFFSPVSLTLDEDAPAFGVEGEWYMRPDVTIGGEFFRFDTDWTSDAGISGDINAGALMFNVKKYFRPEKAVQPYVGAGIGSAVVLCEDCTDFLVVDDNDDVFGSLALQAMAGVAVKGKKLGFYSEFKWLRAQPENDEGNEFDIGGTGLFVGVSFLFGGAR